MQNETLTLTLSLLKDKKPSNKVLEIVNTLLAFPVTDSQLNEIEEVLNK